MPILINNRTPVHAGSGGVLVTADPCQTPVGTVVPYVNVALSSDATNTANNVLLEGYPACHQASFFISSYGDEASLGGAISGTVKGPAAFTTGSDNVMMAGYPAARQYDLMTSNAGNTEEAPLMQRGAPLPDWY